MKTLDSVTLHVETHSPTEGRLVRVLKSDAPIESWTADGKLGDVVEEAGSEASNMLKDMGMNVSRCFVCLTFK